MGYFHYDEKTRAELIRELTTGESGGLYDRKCLKHCTRGNILWSVWVVRAPDETATRYIRCDLMRKVKGEPGWGYKPLCEADHPYYYSCPVSYLDMVPDVACQEWRDKVIAEHNKKHLNVTPGLIVGLTGCKVSALKVIDRTGIWFVGKSQAGEVFRFKRGHMSGEVFETWPKQLGAA